MIRNAVPSHTGGAQTAGAWKSGDETVAGMIAFNPVSAVFRSTAILRNKIPGSKARSQIHSSPMARLLFSVSLGAIFDLSDRIFAFAGPSAD